MTVQLDSNIPYEKLLEKIEQFSAEQKRELADHLSAEASKRQLSSNEKIALLHLSVVDWPINEEPSIRRADWYDD